ncbi:hypothetical protein F66182_7514 [Fusarium sp. NRRL 66182]|nr:hypothetical protein F66182_7514 [Fusarium sp. NRRL 66182]
MGFSKDQILSWLDSVTYQADLDLSKSGQEINKSQQPLTQSHSNLLPSPPASRKRSFLSIAEPCLETPIKKRRRRQTRTAEDIHRTPRPGDTGTISVSGSEVLSLPSCSDSVTSGQVSPTRLAERLRSQPDGLDCLVLDVNNLDLSFALHSFYMNIRAVQMCNRIVPANMQEEINRLSPSRRSLCEFLDNVYDPATSFSSSQKPNAVFLDNVINITDKAIECSRCKVDEAGWNNHVHTPLLELSFRVRDKFQEPRISFWSCTTASILTSYLVDNVPGKKVDYAMFIDPTNDTEIRPQIEVLHKEYGSINHTDFEAFEKRPITISIETKRQDQEKTKANNQMGIWHAAQWRLLERLAGREALTALPFIPGLLVFGHTWHFVASSYKDRKTLLWIDNITMGSTQSDLGVFQIIKGINKLYEWSKDVFWPWYKTYVLVSRPSRSVQEQSNLEGGSDAEAHVQALRYHAVVMPSYDTFTNQFAHPTDEVVYIVLALSGEHSP